MTPISVIYSRNSQILGDYDNFRETWRGWWGRKGVAHPLPECYFNTNWITFEIWPPLRQRWRIYGLLYINLIPAFHPPFTPLSILYSASRFHPHSPFKPPQTTFAFANDPKSNLPANKFSPGFSPFLFYFHSSFWLHSTWKPGKMQNAIFDLSN